MDSPGDWTASALFSPSKARAQQAQARDWASVDNWLSKQYAFERNEETLQALLTLAALNEDADEHRGLVWKVQRAALSAQTARCNDGDEHYRNLLGAMSNEDRESLDAVAGTAAVLDVNSSAAMYSRLCELTVESFELSQQIDRADSQRAAIANEQARLEQLLKELNAPHFQAPDDVLEQTTEWIRNTKHLKAKLAEYDERLSVLRSVPSHSPTGEEFARQSSDLEKLRDRMSALDTDLSAFGNLPSDPKVARFKLEGARKDLRDLVSRRDRLFENLAEND
ncbi:hypothetical protein LTR49_006496 [Elasticomyces elasticus]|nr:hypothetical protein LTR49_006496 [Elasticomyces elasticus]KAK5760655.1 hypothetical protein LTS12_009192 [Elasticomyces elasticus]